MDIQWYPGHMAKTRRIMKETLPLIDVIIELLDARIPHSSKNPEIDALANNKKRLVVLNKCDMADPSGNKKWEGYFTALERGVILANSVSGEGIGEVYAKTQMLVSDKLERMAKKGLKSVPVRAMVVGIPNVGKSAFINKAVGRNGAIVENRPGVTRSKQWLRVKKDFELLDTPGILWPKFDDKDVAVRLALTGAIKDTLLDRYELCLYLIKTLQAAYPDALLERFGVGADISGEEAILAIAKKRGNRIKGGGYDTERTCAMLIDEFRKCKLGRFTLELPGV